MTLAPLRSRSSFALITTLLLGANVLVYGLMVQSGLGFVSFSSKDLLEWGANFRPAVQDGELWRLFTSVFLHGGIMHLVANMLSLHFVGRFLEPALGGVRFFLCYLFCGLAGSVASMAWHENTVSVGASGAIFGLMGAVVSHTYLSKTLSSPARKAILGRVLKLLGYNLVYGLLIPRIDNAAHVGGLIGGLLAGAFFHHFSKPQELEVVDEQ